MDLNAWLEDYSKDKTLREGFDDEYWNQLIAQEKGRTEGINIGRSEGRIEQAKSIANKLLKKDMSPSDIADITGLSIEEIVTLKCVRKRKNKA